MSVPNTSRVAVAIVNYNTREHLKACLCSVFSQAPEEVLVADSGSTDGSCEVVRSAFPSAILVGDGVNRGFGACANLAVARCRAPYVLVLNSDTKLRAGALTSIAAYLDEHPRVAVLGPRLEYEDGTLQRSCYPFPGTLRWVIDNDDLAGLSRRISWLRDRLFRTWPHDRPRNVPWIKGAAMAIRREAFHAIGGFDESFFLYCEDTDLCARMIKTGWQVHFAPVTAVSHFSEASTSQYRARMTALLYSSMMQFCRARYSRVRVAAIFMLLRVAFLLRITRHSLRLHKAGSAQERRQMLEQMQGWREALLGS